MIPAILAVVALGGVLLVANWNEVVNWLRDSGCAILYLS